MENIFYTEYRAAESEDDVFTLRSRRKSKTLTGEERTKQSLERVISKDEEEHDKGGLDDKLIEDETTMTGRVC